MINVLKASLWAVSFSLFALNVFAQTCGTQPTCEELGFVYDSTKCSTASGTSLKCPYDQTKLFCVEQDLEAGAILYSDKTVSKEVISGKTPIAVVFDPEKRLAFALEHSSEIEWSSNTQDVPVLKNCGSLTESGSHAVPDATEVIITDCDDDGKENTVALLAYGKENNISFPAAEYCYNYTTEGTKKGDWFLPSIKEMNTYLINIVEFQRTTQLLYQKGLTPNYKWPNPTKTWTSTEMDLFSALSIGNGLIPIYELKFHEREVYPVIAF